MCVCCNDTCCLLAFPTGCHSLDCRAKGRHSANSTIFNEAITRAAVKWPLAWDLLRLDTTSWNRILAGTVVCFAFFNFCFSFDIHTAKKKDWNMLMIISWFWNTRAGATGCRISWIITSVGGRRASNSAERRHRQRRHFTTHWFLAPPSHQGTTYFYLFVCLLSRSSSPFWVDLCLFRATTAI